MCFAITLIPKQPGYMVTSQSDLILHTQLADGGTHDKQRDLNNIRFTANNIVIAVMQIINFFQKPVFQMSLISSP